MSADKEVAYLLWKKHPFNNGWIRARAFDPADHFTLLTLPLCWLTAHNVQYIKLRQQTNSSWGQSPSEARPAVTAAPAVWTELWSLPGFPLLDPDILNMEHILLQCQHNEIWVKAGSVYSHNNAKNVSVVFTVSPALGLWMWFQRELSFFDLIMIFLMDQSEQNRSLWEYKMMVMAVWFRINVFHLHRKKKRPKKTKCKVFWNQNVVSLLCYYHRWLLLRDI